MKYLVLALCGVFALAGVSLFIGVGDVSLASLLSSGPDGRPLQLLVASRVPRTLALVLAGASMAIAGMIMQMLARNRFVEPSTAGTVESASLGLLAVMLLAPDLPVFARMLVSAAFALAGTALFLRILRFVPLRSVLLVPLVGIMLGGVIGSISGFFAYQHQLMQSLAAWSMGDFSMVLRGRYELLWVCGVLGVIAYIAADRFTVAGMGGDFATNLGLSYRQVMTLGLTIVALVTACVVTTVGMIPFLGLVIPNIVSMFIGDNFRRAVPWVALSGAGFVLACDIFGRLINFPYEIPLGTVVGVVGSALFLYLLLGRRFRLG